MNKKKYLLPSFCQNIFNTLNNVEMIIMKRIVKNE